MKGGIFVAKTYPVYRCDVDSYFSKKRPNCYDCHTQSCQYNTGFSKNPCIYVKDVLVDDEGKLLYETPERPLYPND